MCNIIPNPVKVLFKNNQSIYQPTSKFLLPLHSFYHKRLSSNFILNQSYNSFKHFIYNSWAALLVWWYFDANTTNFWHKFCLSKVLRGAANPSPFHLSKIPTQKCKGTADIEYLSWGKGIFKCFMKSNLNIHSTYSWEQLKKLLQFNEKWLFWLTKIFL